MSYCIDLSSGEKESPNVHNMQPYSRVKTCACGKVVLNHPVTLSCGHQYHFKCARDYIFTLQEDTDENKCILCQRGIQNSFLSNDPYCIEEDEENENEIKGSKVQPYYSNNTLTNQNKVSLNNNYNNSSNQNISVHTSTHNQSHEQSFKYLTPNTTKYPKSSRYSNYQDSCSTKKNQMNSFMLSPPQATLKSPLERVPFSDITQQLNKNSQNMGFSSHQKKFIQYYSLDNSRNQEELDGQNNQHQQMRGEYLEDSQSNIYPHNRYDQSSNFLKQKNYNFISIMGERIINRSLELENNSYPSQSQIARSNNINGVEQFHSEMLQNNSFSAMSFASNSSLSNSSFFQTAGINGQFMDYLLPQSNRLNRMRQLLKSSQMMSHSFNSSMLSIGSDKENARNITTRRTRNNILQISFCEGLSYMCSSSLYTQISSSVIAANQTDISQANQLSQSENTQSDQSQQNMIRRRSSRKSDLVLPFSVEISNLYNLDSANNFRNSQDIVVMIVHDDLNPSQRYHLIKSIFDYIDPTDCVSLAWMESQTKQVFKNQSDYFFGKEMTEIISNEFMRLQAHKERSFRLYEHSHKQQSGEVQQCSVIKEEQEEEVEEEECKEENEKVKENVEGQQKYRTLVEFVKEQFGMLQNKRMVQHFIMISPNCESHLLKEQFSNILTSSIQLPQHLYQLDNPKDFSTQFTSLLAHILDPTRKVNVKSIKLSFEFNPYLNNLVDFNLLNAIQLDAKVQKLTSRTLSNASKSSENLISEDDSEYPYSSSQRKQSEDNVIKGQNAQEEVEEQDSLEGQERNSQSLKKTMEITMDFLREDKLELLFEACFSEGVVPSYTTARLFNCCMDYVFIYCEGISSSSNSSTLSASVNSQQVKPEQTLLSQRHMHLFEEVNQKLSNLYFLLEWHKDTSHLRYNKKLMLSFWKHELHSLPNHTVNSCLYQKYKPIFDSIASKKKTSDFEEFNQFTSYYSNM